MKNRIKKNTNAALVFAVLFLLLCAVAVGQGTPPIVPTETEQLYVISSKAGGVSQIEGDVKVKRSGAATEAALAKGDVLADKDRVLTGTNGRAEVLLNPGSYLRVGENSEIELTDTALDSLQIRLTRGSAIVEANTVGGKNGAQVSIITGQTVVRMEKAGLYRINAAGAVTELYVWEGAARVGNQIVKSGRRLTVGASILTAVVIKFDRSQLDALDLWSAERADELAKLNDRLRRDDLERTLASWQNDYYNSGGYWVFDRRTRTWCYVPYYGGGHKCCRAYGQRHSTAINVKKRDNSVSVVYNPRKYDVSAVDVITKKSSNDASDSSSGKSDYDYSSSPPSKSDSSSSSSSSSSSKSDSSPPPSKSDSPPSPPSKSDNPAPPSKKDNLK